jgi:BMFP domain-containing protein YqiC
MREWVGGMDFVSRDEFEAVKAMAATAREEVEAMRNRLAALEAAMTKAGGSAHATASDDPHHGPASEIETPEE